MSKLSIVVSLVLIAAVQSANECCRSDCPGANGEPVCVDCQVSSFLPGGILGPCWCPSAIDICSGPNGCCKFCEYDGGNADLTGLPVVFSGDFAENIFMFCPAASECQTLCPGFLPVKCCRLDCQFGRTCHDRGVSVEECEVLLPTIECRETKRCCREDCIGQDVCKVILSDKICDPTTLSCQTDITPSRPQECCRTDCEAQPFVCEPLIQGDCVDMVQSIECPEPETDLPTTAPVPTTETPTEAPTTAPTPVPTTETPTEAPTTAPTPVPTTETPTEAPTTAPTPVPTTETPTEAPTTAPETDPPMTAPPTASRLTISPATPAPSDIVTDPPTGTPTTTAPPSGRDSQTGGDPDTPTTPPETSSAVETLTSWVLSFSIALLLCSLVRVYGIN